MEASAKVVEPTLSIVDSEYAEAVEAGLPERGDAIDDRLRVDYLLAKLNEVKTEYTNNMEFIARSIQRTKEHGEREALRLSNRMRWLEERIRSHLPRTGSAMKGAFGKKSLALTNGTVGFKSSQELIAVTDPTKALQWAKDQGLEITVKESVGKTPLHEYVQRTGDIPDPEVCGWHMEPATERFYVALKGGEK